MVFDRKILVKQFPWLVEKNMSMVISASYDGLICASFLHHFLGWKLEGYYDLTSIWVSNNAIKNRENLIWVDLNILPKQGRAIGGQIISDSTMIPDGFTSTSNPNIIANITANKFHQKFPFSTLIYLLWIHNVKIEKSLFARLLTLQSDDVWLKCQNYPENIAYWQNLLPDYDWKWLFTKINSKTFDTRIDQLLYPKLLDINAISGYGKLVSNFMKIKSRQMNVNPDWDEDIIMNLFTLFGNHLKWTPPRLPHIIKRIDGERTKTALSNVKKMGLTPFLKENKVFSYAISSPRIFNFTSFGTVRKSPIEKKYD